jgi:hypothetical protein
VANGRWLSSVARSDSSGVHRVRKSLVSSLSFSLREMWDAVTDDQRGSGLEGSSTVPSMLER